MRCMCRSCGTYMVQADDAALGCVCPECFSRCRDCLGTDSCLTREQLEELKNDPMAERLFFADRSETEE